MSHAETISNAQDMMLEKARLLCKEKLLGQFDANGRALCLTYATVADVAEGKTSKIAAFLHGVLRHSETSAEDLALYGFPAQALAALRALTRLPAEPWHDYARRVQANETARRVKVAELKCGVGAELWGCSVDFEPVAPVDNSASNVDSVSHF